MAAGAKLPPLADEMKPPADSATQNRGFFGKALHKLVSHGDGCAGGKACRSRLLPCTKQTLKCVSSAVGASFGLNTST